QLEDRLIALRPHLPLQLVQAIEDGGNSSGPAANLRGKLARVAPLESLRQDHDAVASRSLAVRSSTSRERSLCATRLATKRALQSAISSRTSRSLSSSVRPVATRSTIPSARPTSGASSTEPFTSTTSAWRPVSSK